MIDIHSHILSLVDDGSSSVDMSLDMLDEAYRDGTKEIVLTPHLAYAYGFENPNYKIKELFGQFKDIVEDVGIPIKMYLGCEFLYRSHESFERHFEDITTLNDTKYLLMEFYFDVEEEVILEAVQDVLDKGYIPVVAHPERFEAIQINPDIAVEIVNRGGYLQMNKGSILGDYGSLVKETVKNLLENKLIGLGTRPEIIRLAAVIKRCREYFDTCVIYYNQNWDKNLSTVFWEDFELKNNEGEFGPDILVPVVGDNLGVTCGNILGRSFELLSELQPDGYLVLGDTNSCLSAISAKRLHIPLFHMEAGNRCKDECLPEETNRRIVDVISDVNLCYSEFARKYLADTGLPKERTYMTGSPMAEVLRGNLDKIQESDVLERLGLEKDNYILLSAHREENIDTEKNFISLFTAINALAEKYDMPILYSCHPRSKNRLEKSGFKLDPRVRVNEPLGFNDYNCLQMNALAIVSDSGTLPEESSFYLSIGHPIAAVCIRTSTERPEALEAGDFILAGITTKELLNATDMAIEMKQKGVLGKPCPDYVDETVSMKVVRIIQGYINVVNKMLWRKY